MWKIQVNLTWPATNWPELIFNPLKMTSFWPVTRLTRNPIDPTRTRLDPPILPCLLRAKVVQTRPEPDNPIKPSDADPILARTEGPNRSATGFRSQKPTPVGRVAGLHLQNPSNPNPTGAVKKSGQILQKQARSGEISTKSSEISTRSSEISTKSSEISTRSSEISTKSG